MFDEIVKLAERIKTLSPDKKKKLEELFEDSGVDVTVDLDPEKELTVCIPTYNSAGTIKRSLDSLMRQEIRPRIIIYDNGSTDGTIELIEAMLRNNVYKDADISFNKTTHVPGGKDKNICFMRFKLTELVNTEFLFFLDSDVMIPPGALKPILLEMKKYKTLGMLGLRYDDNPPHVKMGATILRTELAKKVKYAWDNQGCDCVHTAKQIRSMGHDVAFFNFAGERGKHLNEL